MSNIYEELMAYRQEKAEMIADQEEEYSGSDFDWDNLERAAEKGIVAGAQWLAADFARRIKEGRSTDALLRMCNELLNK